MAWLRRNAKGWGIPAVAFLLLIGVSVVSVVRLNGQMEKDFRDNAKRMARVISHLLASEEGQVEKFSPALHALVKEDPRILGIRLYGKEGGEIQLLMDAAPHLPWIPDHFFHFPAEDVYRVEKLLSFPDAPALFQITTSLSETRTLAVFMARHPGAGLPMILLFVAVSVALFMILIFYFVWQSLWMKGELRARAHAETALSRKSRVDEIFARYSRSLILAGNMEEVASYVLEAAYELTGSRLGYAGYLDPLTGHLVCPVGSGQLNSRHIIRPEALVLEHFSGVWGEVLRHGQPLYANGGDSGRTLSIPTRDGQMPVSCLLSVSAMAGDAMVGQITIGDGYLPYTDADLRVMEKLADLFSLAIRKVLTTRALKESESRFRVAFKTIPDAVILTRLSDYMLVDVNDGFVRMTGFAAEEVRGRTTADLQLWAERADRDTVLERVRSEGKIENYETRFRAKDGRIIHALVSASRTLLHGDPHILSVVRGIDHIREAEYQLRKERSFLSKVVETSPAGILALNPQGRIIFANQKITEILGMDIAEVLERTFADDSWEITDYELRPVPREERIFFLARERRQPIYNIRHTMVEGRGRRIYLSINAATLWREDGELDMIVVGLDDVSEQVKGEHSLVETKGRLHSVLANLPVILWAMDAEGRISLFEGKGTQSVVMPANGFVGVLTKERYADLPPMLRSIEKVLGGDSVSITVEIGERYFEISGSPLWDTSGTVVGASGVASDVTGRIHAEVDRIRLSAAIEQVAESILVTDRQANILYVNPAFERITGWHRDEVMGKTPAILKSGYHGKSFYDEMWQTLFAGRVWQGYITNRKRDGSCYDEEVSISPILDNAGNIINFVAVKRDVSLERNLERQLRQAQKMEAIGTLAGGIAHDFNNILFPIIGFTELALESIDSDRIEHRYLKSIFSAAHRARELVWQILTFSRRSDTERRTIYVHSIVKEALKLLRASIPSTVEIRHDIEAGDARILADPTQIHQVVMNLCTNAYHAMEDGGVMCVGLKTITLSEGTFLDAHPTAIRAGRWQVLTVGDTGMGMDALTMERMFDPYFTTKEQGKGTGLGLATVHGIVTGCGGDIQVSSTPGKGSLFTVYFPVAEMEERSLGDDGQEIIAGGREHILLVDDEDLIVEMLQDTLTGLGYEVTGCWSSSEALEIFRRMPDDFDLLITDQTMPKMTGTVLAAEIQKIRPGFPVILCSGFSDPLGRETLRKGGIVDCVMKPVVRKDIARAVRMALQSQDGGG
ncbi:PAS domain S-box protein [Desulfobotulus sp. H1]|uniref:histidine kinase n=1 Tax=Desulfobotulus pelophilus TaxID=2823377 RepID=A0ABT3NA26_9BACT|nr:PAS domain S-box protein [Desulfobotulus pelophilus]MCW7754315.1 PAS domain S-box protein [Desulfobotulus pelophilus]